VPEKLSPRQEQILKFIKQEIATKGYPPSVREIGEAVGLSSTSTVHSHLAKLEEKGYIRRNCLKTRAIEVLKDDKSYSSPEITYLPIVGRVTAGEPILAVENIEEEFPLPVNFVGNGEAFILNVRGESMIEAGILDGDMVIVRKQNVAHNGDIVVALIDDEATVKRFYKENGFFRLQPENQFMQPIIVKELSILGKVIGLIRKI